MHKFIYLEPSVAELLDMKLAMISRNDVLLHVSYLHIRICPDIMKRLSMYYEGPEVYLQIMAL